MRLPKAGTRFEAGGLIAGWLQATGLTRPLSAHCCRSSRCRSRRGKGAPGQSAALRCGGRRCASTPLRCSNPRPRRATRSAPCGRCAQTGAPSLMTRRAARAGRGSCASRHRIGAPRPARARPCGTHGAVRREQPRTAVRVCFGENNERSKGRGWADGRAPVRRRDAQGLRPRAQRASSSCLSQLFERSARRARSEFCDRSQDRASQGTPAAGRGVALEALPAAYPRPRSDARMPGTTSLDERQQFAVSSRALQRHCPRLCTSDQLRRRRTNMVTRAAGRIGGRNSYRGTLPPNNGGPSPRTCHPTRQHPSKTARCAPTAPRWRCFSG